MELHRRRRAATTGIAHLKTSVGSGLNKALAAIEDANPNTLQDVLKGINFNRKIGQRTMDDSTLVEFIQHFTDIPLGNDDFEFPDLLGAAYEYLIKYFADSAGKKGGEFYTPSEVVRLMVQLIEPKEGMAIYDPTVRLGRHVDPVEAVRARGGRRFSQPRTGRAGTQRRHLGHLQDEHAAARHPQRRHPSGRHAQGAAASGQERRNPPLRPSDRQSTVLAELQQQRA